MKPLLIGLFCAFSFPVIACDGLQVGDGWIPETPPVAAVLAGYATLKNTSDEPLWIDSVAGADFGSAELHEMSMKGGVMQMRPLAKLEVPAHGTVTLAPGGKHLMLMNPKQPLKVGGASTLEFHCGKQVTPAKFTVRATQ